MRRLLLPCLATVALAAPANLLAQNGFFFREPVVTFGLQFGQTLPSAQNGVFDRMTSELTLEPNDFAATSIGGEVAVRMTPRFDVVVGVSRARSSHLSEFRHWVDDNKQPIEQTTALRVTPATASVRYFLRERGRAVGRYAWVPSAVLPYVGAGAGVTWYQLRQEGDFVDFETLDIFRDYLESHSSTPTAHVMAGLQWWPTNRVGLTGEARYLWGSAPLVGAFSDFESIDLRGFQWTAGIAARF